MQHARRDDEIEAVVQLADALDWQLPRFQIRQVVLLFKLIGVFEARRTEIDSNDACCRMSEGVLGGLPRSTTGNENFKICAERLIGPEQVKLRAVTI